MRKGIILFLLVALQLPVFAQAKDNIDKEIEESAQKQEKPETDDDFDKLIEEDLAKEKAIPQTQTNIPGRGMQGGSVLIDRANLPNIFVSADFAASNDLNAGEGDSQDIQTDGADMREVEFGFFGGIDQWATGVAMFAAHQEDGEVFVEAHEIYFEFNRLPYNFFLRVGKMFMDVGELNAVHRHDWAFTQAPLVHAELFDNEAADDFGAELSYLMPWPFFQELKIGVFNGKKFGHAHVIGEKKVAPLYTARLRNFVALTHNWGLKFGASYLRYQRDTTRINVDHTYGLDLTLRWMRARFNFIWSTEAWYRNSVNDASVTPDPDPDKMGMYSFMQVQPHRMWQFGFRFDYLVDIDKFSAKFGKPINDNKYGQSIWATLMPSEFSKFRLTLERQDFDLVDDNYLLIAQATFILGFHPAHKY